MTRRCGAASLAEIILVSWLFGLALVAASAVLAHQRRLASGQRDLVRLQEARRTAGVILGTEIRWLAPSDLLSHQTTGLAVRAVRGSGRLCRGGESWIVVDYRGARAPTPSKDSVLIVHDGGEARFPITGLGGADACGERPLRIEVGALDPPDAGLALVFEPGRYHAVDGAFRYERGLAGRQPLTEAVFGAGELERTRAAYVLRMGVNADSLPLAGDSLIVRASLLNAGREEWP